MKENECYDPLCEKHHQPPSAREWRVVEEKDDNRLEDTTGKVIARSDDYQLLCDIADAHNAAIEAAVKRDRDIAVQCEHCGEWVTDESKHRHPIGETKVLTRRRQIDLLCEENRKLLQQQLEAQRAVADKDERIKRLSAALKASEGLTDTAQNGWESAVDELNGLRQIIKDDCAEDTAIRDLARPIIGEFKADGDSYGVPCPSDVVESLIEHYKQQLADCEKRLTAAREAEL